MQESPLLSYHEAAERLDVAYQTIRAYVHRGVFRAIRPEKVSGHRLAQPFLSADDVEAYERNRGRRPKVGSA